MDEDFFEFVKEEEPNGDNLNPDFFFLSEEEFQDLVEHHGVVMVVNAIENIVERSLVAPIPSQKPFLERIERELKLGVKTAKMNGLA